MAAMIFLALKTLQNLCLRIYLIFVQTTVLSRVSSVTERRPNWGERWQIAAL